MSDRAQRRMSGPDSLARDRMDQNGLAMGARSGSFVATRPSITDPALSMVPMHVLLDWLGTAPVRLPAEPPADVLPSLVAALDARAVEQAAPQVVPADEPSTDTNQADEPTPAPESPTWQLTGQWTLPRRKGLLRRPHFNVSESLTADRDRWDFAIVAGEAPRQTRPHALSDVPEALLGELPPPLVIPDLPPPLVDATLPAAEPWAPAEPEPVLASSGQFTYDEEAASATDDTVSPGAHSTEAPAGMPALIEALPEGFKGFAASRPRPRWRPSGISVRRPRRRAPFAIAALCLVVVLAATGAAVSWRGRPTSGSAPQAAPVVAGIPGVIAGPLITVAAPVDGIVGPFRVAVGDQLAEGADLFSLRVPPDAGRAAALQAQIDDARARAATLAQRVAALSRPTARGRSDTAAAQAALAQARAPTEAASAEVTRLEQALAQNDSGADTATLAIKAEQPSLVGRLFASEGQPVQAGTPVLELADCAHLVVLADAGAASAQGLISGQALRVHLAGDAAAAPGLILHMPPAPPRSGQLVLPIDADALAASGGDRCPMGRAVTFRAN